MQTLIPDQKLLGSTKTGILTDGWYHELASGVFHQVLGWS